MRCGDLGAGRSGGKSGGGKIETEILAECTELDKGFKIEISEAAAPQSMGTTLAQKDVIGLLYLAPNGVLSMSPTMEGLVESSSNMGVVHTEGTDIWVAFSREAALRAGRIRRSSVCRFWPRHSASSST